MVACGGDEQLTPLPTETDLTGAVDPRIGTGGIGFGQGSTYPGPALPYAMIHPGPDTTEVQGGAAFAHCSGYYWEDPLIEGFSLTRMNGTGVPDYGTIAVMAVDGMSGERTEEKGYRAGFDHADEVAAPGYYRARLDSGIVVEITSTLRAAVFRFTFPAGADPVVLMDFEHTIGDGTSAGGAVRLDPTVGELSGYMHNLGDLSNRYGGFEVYAHGAFDPLPQAMGVWDEDGLHDDRTQVSGVDVGGWAQFPAGTTTVTYRVAMSFVDELGAEENLAAEAPHFDFDAVRGAAADVWSEALGSLRVWGADAEEATLVATALYHVLLMPTLMSDVDGRAVNVNGVAVQSDRPRYSDFSLWDTYRTLHPWLMLAEHPLNAAFAASMLQMADEGGAVPRWALARGDIHSMIGSPGEIVIAESAAKGVPLDDEVAAYEMARSTALGPSPGPVGGRGSIESYLENGYVAADDAGGSVSKTMEYAIADAALADWARRLGKGEDADMLEEQAQSWRALYLEEEGFFWGKNADGSWVPFNGATGQTEVFTEGTAWQYLWLVPQDPEALAEVLGGTAAAMARLDELFQQSAEEVPALGFRRYYWHGNEPDLHVSWLYAAWGDRDRAVRWVRWAAEQFYNTSPDGIPGNDDGGTMSAWLLFATAGIYPIAGFDRYLMAAPMFPRVVVHRQSGDLTIEATPDPRSHPRVLAIELDGKPVTDIYLRHADLVGDHLLSFTMGGWVPNPAP